MKQSFKKGSRISVRELAVFAMLGALMFCGDITMNWAMNVHFVSAFLMVYTIVYRSRALIPFYLYTVLIGLYEGFGLWWLSYLYIWLPLWGVTMLLPRRMPRKVAIPVYAVVCALHGLSFGTLYAPLWALIQGLNMKGILTWIAFGFSADVLHAVGNFAGGLLIVPMSELLLRLEKKTAVRATRSPR